MRGYCQIFKRFKIMKYESYIKHVKPHLFNDVSFLGSLSVKTLCFHKPNCIVKYMRANSLTSRDFISDISNVNYIINYIGKESLDGHYFPVGNLNVSPSTIDVYPMNHYQDKMAIVYEKKFVSNRDIGNPLYVYLCVIYDKETVFTNDYIRLKNGYEVPVEINWDHDSRCFELIIVPKKIFMQGACFPDGYKVSDEKLYITESIKICFSSMDYCKKFLNEVIESNCESLIGLENYPEAVEYVKMEKY